MSWSLGEVGDRETRLLLRDLRKFQMDIWMSKIWRAWFGPMKYKETRVLRQNPILRSRLDLG